MIKVDDTAVLHITHNDADGVGCGVLTRVMLHQRSEDYILDGNNGKSVSESRKLHYDIRFCAIQMVPNIMKQLLDDWESGEKPFPKYFFFTDLPFPMEYYDRFEKLLKENHFGPYYRGPVDKFTMVIGVDHHATNPIINMEKPTWFTVIVDDDAYYEYDLDNYPEEVTVYHETVSATYLLFDKFRFYDILDKRCDKDIVRNLSFMVKNISRYDTWEWKNPYAACKPEITGKEDMYATICSMVGPNKAYHHFIDSIYSGTDSLETMAEFSREHDYYERGKNKSGLRVIDLSDIIPVADHVTVAVGIDMNALSSTAEWILIDYPQIDFMLTIWPKRSMLSLSSKKDEYDCGAICKKYFNGGGHKGAAGGTFDSVDDMLSLIKRYHTEGISIREKYDVAT